MLQAFEKKKLRTHINLSLKEAFPHPAVLKFTLHHYIQLPTYFHPIFPHHLIPRCLNRLTGTHTSCAFLIFSSKT